MEKCGISKTQQTPDCEDKKQATVTGTQIEGGWESVNTFNDSNIILEHFVTEFSGINHSQNE